MSDLRQAVRAYSDAEVSLNRFVDWFEDASLLEPSSEDVQDALFHIELSLSRLRDGELSTAEFDRELANAVRPFARPEQLIVKVYDPKKNEHVGSLQTHWRSALASGVIVLLAIRNGALEAQSGDHVVEPAHNALDGATSSLIEQEMEVVLV